VSSGQKAKFLDHVLANSLLKMKETYDVVSIYKTIFFCPNCAVAALIIARSKSDEKEFTLSLHWDNTTT
jgi:ribosomal protein S26